MTTHDPVHIATVGWQRHELAILVGRDPEDESWGVPDLTTNSGRWCDAMHPDGPICTRQNWHRGRHAAGNGSVIVAVWS